MIKLTKAQADEIRHRLSVHCLDCGLTEAQVEELVQSVPVRGEWIIPGFGIRCVQNEMQNIANIRLDQSQDLPKKEREKLLRQMREFDSLAEDLGDLLQIGHIHQWQGSRCIVEGCRWVRATSSRPRTKAPKPKNSPRPVANDGPKSLRGLLRFM